MRKLALLCAALALSACSTLSALPGGASLSQSAPQSVADSEKALAIAHLAFQAAGVSLQQAAQSGALHGTDAAAAQALYDKAGAALAAADTADAAANAQGVLAALGDATALIAQLHALIPAK